MNNFNGKSLENAKNVYEMNKLSLLKVNRNNSGKPEGRSILFLNNIKQKIENLERMKII